MPGILEWVPILAIRIGTDLEKKTKIKQQKIFTSIDNNHVL